MCAVVGPFTASQITAPSGGALLLLVDALDECDDDDNGETLLGVLTTAHSLPPWLRIVVSCVTLPSAIDDLATKPEAQRPVGLLQLRLDYAANHEDIVLALRGGLGALYPCSDADELRAVAEGIRDRGDGTLFLFVHLLLEELHNEQERGVLPTLEYLRDDVDHLPATLGDMFTRYVRQTMNRLHLAGERSAIGVQEWMRRTGVPSHRLPDYAQVLEVNGWKTTSQLRLADLDALGVALESAGCEMAHYRWIIREHTLLVASSTDATLEGRRLQMLDVLRIVAAFSSVRLERPFFDSILSNGSATLGCRLVGLGEHDGLLRLLWQLLAQPDFSDATNWHRSMVLWLRTPSDHQDKCSRWMTCDEAELSRQPSAQPLQQQKELQGLLRDGERLTREGRDRIAEACLAQRSASDGSRCAEGLLMHVYHGLERHLRVSADKPVAMTCEQDGCAARRYV